MTDDWMHGECRELIVPKEATMTNDYLIQQSAAGLTDVSLRK